MGRTIIYPIKSKVKVVNRDLKKDFIGKGQVKGFNGDHGHG